MEKVPCIGRNNCWRISNGTVEFIVPTDIGPRVVHYAFVGEENILGEVPGVSMQTELGTWKPWGGHRLWAAPESMPGSYSIDDEPVQYENPGELSIVLRQSASKKTAMLEKSLSVSLDSHGSGLTLDHKITNRNLWGIDVAPWALTIMKAAGVAILPQEPYRSHDDYLLAARPMTLWYFTDLSDPRFTIGAKYICLRSDPAKPTPQKVGIANKQRWAAYLHGQTLFVKRFAFIENAVYPDYGSNNEAYTEGSFMELESLGPVQHLEPGASIEHRERWNLFRTSAMHETSDSALDEIIKPVLAELGPV